MADQKFAGWTALVVAAAISASAGCLLPCHNYERAAQWHQDDGPIYEIGSATIEVEGILGGIWAINETKTVYAQIFDDQPVPREDLETLVYGFYDQRGWERPTLPENQHSGCSTEL